MSLQGVLAIADKGLRQKQRAESSKKTRAEDMKNEAIKLAGPAWNALNALYEQVMASKGGRDFLVDRWSLDDGVSDPPLACILFPTSFVSIGIGYSHCPTVHKYRPDVGGVYSSSSRYMYSPKDEFATSIGNNAEWLVKHDRSTSPESDWKCLEQLREITPREAAKRMEWCIKENKGRYVVPPKKHVPTPQEIAMGNRWARAFGIDEKSKK